MIGFCELGGIHMLLWLPCVVAFGISLPFDQVLEHSGLAMALVATDGFYFIFRFAFNQVRWWLGVVGAVCGCFAIG